MRRVGTLLASTALAAGAACGAPAVRPEAASAVASAVASEGPATVTLSIVGTNDLHGHLGALPVLGGFVENLRRARAADGAVLLLDGGDMFQGTLESNLQEGAGVVLGYEALGYDAVTIGNHEFDYGPVGPASAPRGPGDDPRGALRALIRDAEFPFLNANLVLREGGGRPALGWPSVLLERAGVRIGIIGVTTEQTLGTTLASNVADLALTPLVDALVAEASALRARGAQVVVAVAHAGGHCARFEDPDDLSSCDAEEEIMHVAAALPRGTLDAVVAGHTHQAMAHRVNGVPIVESWSYGQAFGRIDLVVDRAAGRVVEARLHPPQRLCTTESARAEDGVERCVPGIYEGAAVQVDARVAQAVAPSIEGARAQRGRSLGVVLGGAFERSRGAECALGNLFTDLMLRARPGADVAIVNGGGLRADLPAGPLTYGALYEAFPFDNRFARVRVRGAELRAMIERMMARDGSFFSVAGITAEVACVGGEVRATLRRAGGAEVSDDAELTVLTSDFLAVGGDGFFSAARASQGGPDLEDDPPIREAMVEVLLATGGTLEPRAAFDPDAPRVRSAGPRPLRCP